MLLGERSDDDWAAGLQVPPRHHERAALKGQVLVAFILVAFVVIAGLAFFRFAL